MAPSSVHVRESATKHTFTATYVPAMDVMAINSSSSGAHNYQSVLPVSFSPRLIASLPQTYQISLGFQGEAEAEALAWQKKFQDLMAVEVHRYSDTFQAFYRTGRSLADALEESVSGEVFLFVITCKWQIPRVCGGPMLLLERRRLGCWCHFKVSRNMYCTLIKIAG